MIEKQEKRQHQRVPFYNVLQYRLHSLTQSIPEKPLRNADILDISSGGVRIRTIGLETNFDIGSILFLNIPLQRLPVTIPTLGKVKWIKLDKNNTRQVGIEFIFPY